MTDIQILIIGGASLDTLRAAGKSVAVAGGAGMYTALAARRSAAQVTLFAPRPDPIPAALQAVAERVAWQGPTVKPADLPHFEIAYHAGETTYLQASFGAETTLSPDALPSDLAVYDCVHVVPLGDIRRQHDFMLACRERGARRISAGTAVDLIDSQPEVAHAVLAAADLFFMNEEEAVRLFGSVAAAKTAPGKTLFVTKGKKGAIVVQGSFVTEVPGVAAEVVDPTGAGDTFCGAALACLARGKHPVMAARGAMLLAAQATEDIGPAALLGPPLPPEMPLDRRVVVNPSKVSSISDLIAALPEVTPFDFTGPDLPAIGHPAALDTFFAATLQQFGFWTEVAGKYSHPLIATIDGEQRKGAFYLFRAYLRCLEDAPELLTPARQADLTKADMLALLRADDGSDPVPVLELHLAQAQQYGRDMLALGLTPQTLLDQVNASSAPLQVFFQMLDHIGGYKEDPLRKKAGLLAIILQQRPEGFLSFSADEEVTPVIDYHLMRSCLRTGLIDVMDETLSGNLVSRKLLPPEDEWAVRYAAYTAVEQVVAKSGKSTGAVDWFFFNARTRCPEMTEPLCDLCEIDPVCAHRKELFQPVLRTTFY